MAFVQGYVLLPTNTYLAWKNAVSGNGYDADGYYGDQCWDLTAEFWYNLGFGAGYPLTGPNQYASECWTVSREANCGDKFDLVYNLSDVKQGDIVVFNGTTANPPGHIGFADEDYNGSGYIKILGQNQGSGGTPPPVINPAGGTTANVNNLYVLSDFLGAFRYREWHGHTPTIQSKPAKSHFPWVLYARKLRNKR